VAVVAPKTACSRVSRCSPGHASASLSITPVAFPGWRCGRGTGTSVRRGDRAGRQRGLLAVAGLSRAILPDRTRSKPSPTGPCPSRLVRASVVLCR